MPATSRDVHLLTHTARMLLAVEAKPKHSGARSYTATIAGYKPRWAMLSKPDRADAAKQARAIGDMTDAVVAAAVAALEG